MTKPEDIGSAVALANGLVAKTPRRVDFVHLPVARKAFDPSYYAALRNLKIGDAKVYLGLIHDSEKNLDEFRRRLSAAKQHREQFGLASVCGYGRCNLDELKHALEMHRMVMNEVKKA